MFESQLRPDEVVAKVSSAQFRGEASGDPVGEMIEVFQSLGLLVTRGPTISAEEYEILSRPRPSTTQHGPIEGLSSNVSASGRIVDALASEAP